MYVNELYKPIKWLRLSSPRNYPLLTRKTATKNNVIQLCDRNNDRKKQLC